MSDTDRIMAADRAEFRTRKIDTAAIVTCKTLLADYNE